MTRHRHWAVAWSGGRAGAGGRAIIREGTRRWWRRAADIWRRSARKRSLRKVIHRIRRGEPVGITFGNQNAVEVLELRHLPRWTPEDLHRAKQRALQLEVDLGWPDDHGDDDERTEDEP